MKTSKMGIYEQENATELVHMCVAMVLKVASFAPE